MAIDYTDGRPHNESWNKKSEIVSLRQAGNNVQSSTPRSQARKRIPLRPYASAVMQVGLPFALTLALAGCAGKNEQAPPSSHRLTSKEACEGFASMVTLQLLDRDENYGANTGKLLNGNELSSPAIAKLQQEGLLAQSQAAAEQVATDLTKSKAGVSARVDHSGQAEAAAGKQADKDIQVDVNGVVIKHSPKGESQGPFHLRYVLQMKQYTGSSKSGLIPFVTDVQVMPN